MPNELFAENSWIQVMLGQGIRMKATLVAFATDGTLTTVSSSDYLVRTPFRSAGTIERAPGVSWPTPHRTSC